MTLTYLCDECDTEFDIDYTPPLAARLHGPPENCYPGEDESFEPEKCPECKALVDMRNLESLVDNKVRSLEYDYEAE